MRSARRGDLWEQDVGVLAWSRQPPESFVGFVGAPISRMNIAAFWKPVAPLFALSGLGALAVAFRAGTQGAALIASST